MFCGLTCDVPVQTQGGAVQPPDSLHPKQRKGVDIKKKTGGGEGREAQLGLSKIIKKSRRIKKEMEGGCM